jgi:hypothetical protein
MITAADVREVAMSSDRFRWPKLSDQRFHWINAYMAALGEDEMRELITDAWRLVVTAWSISAARFLSVIVRPGGAHGDGVRAGGRAHAGIASAPPAAFARVRARAW